MTLKSTHSPTFIRSAGPGNDPLVRIAPRAPAPTASTEPQVRSTVKGMQFEVALQMSSAVRVRMLDLGLVMGVAKAAEASERKESALVNLEPAIVISRIVMRGKNG